MNTNLDTLGWRHYFASQLSLDDYDTLLPTRVMSVERSTVTVQSETGEHTCTLPQPWTHWDPVDKPTVGDWLMLSAIDQSPQRVLERQSEIKRRAAGAHAAEQLIAANVDTLMIVSSCNQDFNLSRFERYLALARQSMIDAVIVLTKADLATSPDSYLEQLQALPDVAAFALNALDTNSTAALAEWGRPGQTLALVGSSGVGKSTLINMLLGGQIQETGAIRESDAKGRHTTTRRSLFVTPKHGLVLDSPGMRELQLTDVADGIAEVFADIEELAQGCKFKDCQHEQEPSCAVRSAIEQGDLDERRLHNYRKLQREDAFNTMTFAQRRSAGRKFNKQVRASLAAKAEFGKEVRGTSGSGKQGPKKKGK